MKLTVLIFLFSLAFLSKAQVANDLIANRLELKIDQPFHSSSTTNCTVEWECVDQSLTGKCIQYHNDQWFWFSTQQKMKYYINVAGQNCRDLRGVQLVVIDGVPCQTETYKPLYCISLANQDDIFLEMDSLQANHNYLLNIDGYLNDNCSFDIQVSTQPKGIPVMPATNEKQVDTTAVTFDQNKEQVLLTWKVSEALANEFVQYNIWRRYDLESKSEIVGVVPHEKNAFGVSTLTYSFTNSIQMPGKYYYKIVAETTDRHLTTIVENSVNTKLASKFRMRAGSSYIAISTPCQEASLLIAQIYDATTHRLLAETTSSCDREKSSIYYNILPFKKKGILHYKVVVISSQEEKEYEVFFVD